MDAFRLYAMNEAYEELLTLPKVFPVIAMSTLDRASIGGFASAQE